MDAESSSNIVSQPQMETMVKYSRGTDSEVLRIKSSTLWLMAGGQDENQTVGVVRKGEFSFHIIMQNQSPILITFCMVGDLQWPLTKDSPVLRVGFRSFAFAMPGLLYGLQFSGSCCEEVLEILERVLMRFGHYEDRSRRETGFQFSVPENDPRFWAISQFNIQKFTEPFLTQLGAINKSPTCIDDTNEQVLRVMRMSAITKMITKGVLVGGIDPIEHIEIFGPKSFLENEDGDFESRACATIFVFSDIVEAVEASGLIVSGKYHTMPPYEPKWSPIPNITFWNINKAGLIRLLQVMVASATMMNVEVTADSTEKNEDVHKIVEAMDEDPPKITEEMAKTGEKVRPNVEKNVNVFEDQIKNKNKNKNEVVASIREIRFSIINEAESSSRIETNPVEELREACASMEVA